MNCIKCNAILKDGAKFCVKCGEKVVLKQYCQSCKTEIGDGDAFCAECGNPIVQQEAKPIVQAVEKAIGQQIEKPIVQQKANPTVVSAKVLETYNRSKLTKAQSEKLSQDEKKAITKLKKDEGFIFYDCERNYVFMQRENWSYIDVIIPSDLKKPIARFTLPKDTGLLLYRMSDRSRYLFYTNEDAFITWDDYIFISVYKGKICWSAADYRDEERLPGAKANEYIMCPGGPELELLPDGKLKIIFASGEPVTYRIERGVLIPWD